MVRAFDGLAARAGAAGDAADEQRGLDAARARAAARWPAGWPWRSSPGAPTCGVGDGLRCSGTAQVNCARRCGAPCAMLVHGFVAAAVAKRKSAEMSTKRGLVPAASAALSSESISAAAAPCGAAQKTALTSARFAISAAISACDLNAVSPSTPGEMRKRLAASSPGWLSDRMPASSKFGWPSDQAQQFAGHVAGAAEHDGGNLVARHRVLVRRAVERARLRQAERLDDAVAERRAGRQRVERRHLELLLDDLHADGVVGGRARDRGGLDAVSARAGVHAAPGRDRVVGRQHHAGERLAHVFLLEDRVDAVGAEEAVAQLEHDDVGLLRPRARSASCA